MNKLNYFNIALLISIITVFTFSPSYAQYNVIGIDIIGGLTGVARPSFERSFGKHFSALINYESGQYASGTSGSLSSQTEVYTLNGKGWMPEVRLYPFTEKKLAPRGFFLGAYYRRMTFEESYNDDVRVSNPFATTTTTMRVNIESEAKSTNVGGFIGYKFSAGPIIIEPLLGFGSINYEWDNPTERELIDPFFRTNLDDFQFTGRAELKFGFYFPQMEAYEEHLEDIPSQNVLQSNLINNTESTTKNNIKLFVYRPKKFSGFAISYNILVDDSIAVNMTNGSYHLVELDSTADYRISARTEEIKVISTNLQKGKVYYLRCKVGSGLFIGRPKFEFVEPAIGEGEILELKAKEN